MLWQEAFSFKQVNFFLCKSFIIDFSEVKCDDCIHCVMLSSNLVVEHLNKGSWTWEFFWFSTLCFQCRNLWFGKCDYTIYYILSFHHQKNWTIFFQFLVVLLDKCCNFLFKNHWFFFFGNFKSNKNMAQTTLGCSFFTSRWKHNQIHISWSLSRKM